MSRCKKCGADDWQNCGHEAPSTRSVAQPMPLTEEQLVPLSRETLVNMFVDADAEVRRLRAGMEEIYTRTGSYLSIEETMEAIENIARKALKSGE